MARMRIGNVWRGIVLRLRSLFHAARMHMTVIHLLRMGWKCEGQQQGREGVFHAAPPS